MNRILLIIIWAAAALALNACSDKGGAATLPPPGGGKEAVAYKPEQIRLLYFSYAFDQILEQTPDESDEDFARRLQQQGHRNASASLQHQRQRILAARATTQTAQQLQTLYEWQSNFQRDVNKNALEEAKWCDGSNSLVSLQACQNYRRLKQWSARRLRIVNTRIAQLGGQGIAATGKGGQAEWDAQQDQLRIEREYQEQMRHINEEEAKWNRAKREQEARRPGNPYDQ